MECRMSHSQRYGKHVGHIMERYLDLHLIYNVRETVDNQRAKETQLPERIASFEAKCEHIAGH
ncbi:hypothetical protein P171DRAFT_38517 [Karstenula rhodostoma CBS 690.94]|uniref:Uncharacterized protein n=1 Tax=Karstenula rhodostoma CBS 690.94 TaxID=1392251 RepID=A0A9P4UBU9_9PLEO|nr:hypothetical protein P171DRAFT_38517 [Karstenula rhodostoma CBS 690.94]